MLWTGSSYWYIDRYRMGEIDAHLSLHSQRVTRNVQWASLAVETDACSEWRLHLHETSSFRPTILFSRRSCAIQPAMNLRPRVRWSWWIIPRAGMREVHNEIWRFEFQRLDGAAFWTLAELYPASTAHYDHAYLCLLIARHSWTRSSFQSRVERSLPKDGCWWRDGGGRSLLIKQPAITRNVYNTFRFRSMGVEFWQLDVQILPQSHWSWSQGKGIVPNGSFDGKIDALFFQRSTMGWETNGAKGIRRSRSCLGFVSPVASTSFWEDERGFSAIFLIQAKNVQVLKMRDQPRPFSWRRLGPIFYSSR